ncbi:hypothetical protein [Methylomicrobium sp. Wu6]|uniref:hypothetical protein n=1 Tax=Methylomicrobium sp. Wu6 TaxID=3107928 RepID=UPI002DD69D82|nr:hypothetical protein [Methylomicrobium sp. Wu6]MEC4749363.1 hypothetical protein [Methylomicrobium sp. Wu6]
MSIFDSIAIEIQAMVAGVLVLLIITLLEIIDLQRGKKRHRQELQAIAGGVIQTQKEQLVSLFSLILEFIFGFAAFALFAYATMYLTIMEMPALATVAGVSAFIGVMMPFVVWSACRKANRETADALQNIERHRHETAGREQTPVTPIAPPIAASVAEETASIPTEPVAIDPKPVVKPQPAPVPPPEDKPAVYPKPDPAHVFPRDSILRRHFITHLAAMAKPYELLRPTDSILSRHHDAMLAHQTGMRHAKPVTAEISDPVAAKSYRKCTHKIKLPEDSMLRRHILATLQIKIEPRLSLPVRPTDAMLRRHYDTLKENLIATELNKYLEG